MTIDEVITRLQQVPKDTPIYTIGTLFFVTGTDRDYVTTAKSIPDFLKTHHIKTLDNYAKVLK
jgi:hypothetical protein